MVKELADGLDETYQRHLGLGLAPQAAAEAAVAEFGDPQLIAAEFTVCTRRARRPAGCCGSGPWWVAAGL